MEGAAGKKNFRFTGKSVSLLVDFIHFDGRTAPRRSVPPAKAGGSYASEKKPPAGEGGWRMKEQTVPRSSQRMAEAVAAEVLSDGDGGAKPRAQARAGR